MLFLECELTLENFCFDTELRTEQDVIEFDIQTSETLKPYIGQYEVIPKTFEQILETKNLGMTDDVTVKEIPTHEVSNNFGTTIIIGGIV